MNLKPHFCKLAKYCIKLTVSRTQNSLRVHAVPCGIFYYGFFLDSYFRLTSAQWGANAQTDMRNVHFIVRSIGCVMFLLFLHSFINSGKLSKLCKSGCVYITHPNIVQFWKLKSLLKAYKKFDWLRAVAHSFCVCSSSPGIPEIYCLV